MTKKADITFQDNQLVLSGDLDFYNVMSVYEKSLSLLDRCPDITVDFSRLVSSDSSGLALMMEWKKLGRHCSKKVTFHQVSAKLTSMTKVAGIEDLI